MKVCDLICYLKDLPQDAEVDISVDISIGDDDIEDRAFTREFLDHVEHGDSVTLLFSGYLNNR